MTKFTGIQRILVVLAMLSIVVRSFRMNRPSVRLWMASTDVDIKVSTKSKRSMSEQVQAASIASAAAVAAAAVNAAVSMRPLTAPDSGRTFVFKDGGSKDRIGKVDEVGLPLVYDRELIQAYWQKQGSALNQRWSEFLGYSVPFLTKVITILVSGGSEELKASGAELARDARIIFEKLGPTYIKMGQMMSVRPDVLPAAALEELKVLQDSVKPFDTATAIKQIESELGGPLGQFFSEISQEPVAAASLAQVYKARLVSTGEVVAIKIQRPAVLEVVSKDLYVLRRAAEVYQGLVDRFAPNQKTNYVALLNEWAVGFYTELDFLNEAANQERLKKALTDEGVTGMYVPKVYHDYCTRRVLVSEWVDGVKLSSVPKETLQGLIPDAQEAFLTQLLQIGFFHSDPHPGNIMYLNEPRGEARMALLDFGLVASIRQEDMDTMVSALIHLANKDYPSLVDDFILLGILPKDCNRAKVVPLMDKALTPYVKGGGAKTYEEELKKIYGMDGSMSGTAGGFQAMTQDALTVLNDIPFSIPPYFALLGRAIVTLEGVALTGDPRYGIIMESYPFVARKLLKEDRPEIQKALQQVLYGRGSEDGLQGARLSVLLNSALGVVAKTSDAFVDFDSVPEDGISLGDAIKFIVSPGASSLRKILVEEAITAGDILTRQAARKAFKTIIASIPRPPLFGRFLPKPEKLAIPFFIPSLSSTSTLFSSGEQLANELRTAQYVPVLLTSPEFVDGVMPGLSREEEFYAISLADVAQQTFGSDLANIVNGNVFTNARDARQAMSRLAGVAGQPIFSQVMAQPAVRRLVERSVAPFAALQQGSSLLSPPSRSASATATSKSGGNKEDDSLKEVVTAVQSLSTEEQAVLQQTVSNVVLGLLQKAITRARSLLKQ